MRYRNIVAIVIAGFILCVSRQSILKTSMLAMPKNSLALQQGKKEVTVLIDHYRPPCVNPQPKLCYLLTTEDSPNSYPYFYGEIEGFKYQWGHKYKLRVVEEFTAIRPNENSYRLIEVLSDKKSTPSRSFRLPLKHPLNEPFYTVDDSLNVSLISGVKIKFFDQKLKSRLISLQKTAGSTDSISGDFKHDPKEGNSIILTMINYEKR